MAQKDHQHLFKFIALKDLYFFINIKKTEYIIAIKDLYISNYVYGFKNNEFWCTVSS